MKMRRVKVKRNRFTLYPLSDVHWPNHDTDRLLEWKKAAMADKEGLVTLGGDLFDFARTKYSRHLQSYTADDNSRDPIDNMAYGQIEDMAGFLAPLKDKIVGCVVGNHRHTFKNWRVSDQELCLQMGIPDVFLGAFGMIQVVTQNRTAVDIAIHHDAGRRGGTESADILAFYHWSANVSADIYVAGHTHRQYVKPARAKIGISKGEGKPKTVARDIIYCRSGAFMKGYADSVIDPRAPYSPDYAEERMLPASIMGILKITVSTATGSPQYDLGQATITYAEEK